MIEEVVSLNAVKLRLPSSMRIHLVVNISRIVRYKEQVVEQKKVEEKPVDSNFISFQFLLFLLTHLIHKKKKNSIT